MFAPRYNNCVYAVYFSCPLSRCNIITNNKRIGVIILKFILLCFSYILFCIAAEIIRKQRIALRSRLGCRKAQIVEQRYRFIILIFVVRRIICIYEIWVCFFGNHCKLVSCHLLNRRKICAGKLMNYSVNLCLRSITAVTVRSKNQFIAICFSHLYISQFFAECKGTRCFCILLRLYAKKGFAFKVV